MIRTIKKWQLGDLLAHSLPAIEFFRCVYAQPHPQDWLDYHFLCLPYDHIIKVDVRMIKSVSDHPAVTMFITQSAGCWGAWGSFLSGQKVIRNMLYSWCAPTHPGVEKLLCVCRDRIFLFHR